MREKNFWLEKNRKFMLLFFMSMILMSCNKKSTLTLIQKNQKSDLTEIKIERIEKFKNFYFIYARDTQYNSGYKIISSVDYDYLNVSRRKSHPNQIEIGKVYKLKLFWISEPKQEDKVGNYLEFKRCITKFPMVEICTESGFELYECSQLKGLELVKNE